MLEFDFKRGMILVSDLELKFRQVHLDFHTSPDIEGIGANFDAEKFAETLEKAHVDSVTCFARCHHGLLYYDSKINPERIHPQLADKDLLAKQINACHSKGIRVPIYTTVQWDYYTACQHPEWRIVGEGGELVGQKPFEPGFYGFLCVNTSYRDFLKEHTREILETFPVDGLFFDILMIKDCSCKYCVAGMKKMGLDPSNREVRLQYAQQVIDNFKIEMTNFIRQFNEECTIFYNKGHVGTAHRAVTEAYTHFELETLPSGGWGYLHFPITVRYARNLGLDCLAQTGKFHTSWGDFRSFKNREALEFECFNMLAQNAKCMIGDQLEPSGALSPAVYDLIGSVYSQVEKKEPWCVGARAVVDIGVFTPEEFDGAGVGDLSPAILGATKILQRASAQFDIIDSMSDFSHYKVLILPDDIPVSDKLAEKLSEYIAQGGAVIATFESGMNSDKGSFNFKELGVRLKDNATLTTDGVPARGQILTGNAYADYILPKGEIGRGLPQTEHVMYMKGTEVEPSAGSEVLSDVIEPYFNRTYERFCSHRQTPSSGKEGYAGIVKNGNVIYFAHPIFRLYNQYAPNWCKQLLLNALDMLLPNPLIRHNGPTTVLSSVNKQQNQNRMVVHLLHYVPERVAQTIDIIDDVIPLYNTNVSVRASEVVKVELVPEMEDVIFTQEGDRISFAVPEINGHQMIAIHFKETV